MWRTLDSIYPNKIDVAFKLATSLAASRDSANLKEAIGIYEKLENRQGKSIPMTSRKNVDNNTFAGDVYAQFSMPDSALVYYNRACELDPSSGAAYYSRATFYKTIGDSIAFDREVFNALKRESLDLDTKLELMTGYISELYEDESQHPRIEELFASFLENPSPRFSNSIRTKPRYMSYIAPTFMWSMTLPERPSKWAMHST